MAMSVCIFFLWTSVYVVSQSFPMLLASIGSAFTFWIYMLMSVLAFLFVYKLIPETKGKSLEEIERFWKVKNVEAEPLIVPKTSNI
jgi:SP family arabinose:H+ symporter-like MFS transporter